MTDLGKELFNLGATLTRVQAMGLAAGVQTSEQKLAAAKAEPDDDMEICGWCGSEEHIQEECPEYRQELADRAREEREYRAIDNSRIEAQYFAANRH